MKLSVLLSELHQRGIRLEARGDRLRYAPREAVEGELKAAIIAHKERLLLLAAPTCPRCGAPAKVTSSDLHRHLWCGAQNCSWDCWEAIQPGDTLSGIFGEPTGRQMTALLLAAHHCPGCGQDMTLQDQARDVWWCVGCQVFFIAGVMQ